MKKQVKCTNVGVCTRAGKVYVVDDEELQELVCPECGEPLEEVKETTSQSQSDDESKKKKKKNLFIIASLILLLAIGLVCFLLLLNPKQYVKELTLDKQSVNLSIGQTDRLTVNVSPTGVDPELIWESSNEKIASVLNDGVVTAKEPGKATISVYVKEQKSIKATCEYIVVESDVDMTSLKINEDVVRLKPGGEQRLTVSFEPVNQTESISFESSDESIAKVSPRGKVDALKVGEVTITAKSERTGLSATSTVIVVKNLTDTKVGGGEYVSSQNASHEQGIGSKLEKGSITTTSKIQHKNNKKDLGYGIYEGDMPGGVPNGFGTVIFTKEKKVNADTYAEPGYKIRNARFTNGKLQSGTLYDKDGIKVCFIDANNNL